MDEATPETSATPDGVASNEGDQFLPAKQLLCEESPHDPSLVDALLTAVRALKLDRVQLVVGRSCDINCRDANGDTALCEAILHKATEIAEYLVHKGCDVNLESACKGLPPISLAVLNAQEQIFDTLLKAGCDVDKPDWDGLMPLHHAVFRGEHKLAAKLIEAGCKVNAKSQKNEMITPLHAACINGDFDMVKLLLAADRCSDLQEGRVRLNDQTAINLYSALHYAVRMGSAEIVKELARNGADVMTRNRRGSTPLLLCVLSSVSSRYEIANILLQHGGGASSVHQQATARRTELHRGAVPLGVIPLHVAVQNGDVKMVELLLRHQVDICEKGSPPSGRPIWVRPCDDNPSLGVTVIHACLDNGRSVQLLDCILAAARERCVRPDASGWECLSSAIEWPLHMWKLVDYGLDVTATRHGYTILHEEECLIRPLSVKTLLKMGVSASWRTPDEGVTALHRLAVCDEEHSCAAAILDTAAALVDYGADVNARDNYHSTPIMMALEHHHFDLAEYFVRCGAEVTPDDAVRVHWRTACQHSASALCIDCQLRISTLLTDARAAMPSLAALSRDAVRRWMLSCGAVPVSAAIRGLCIPVRIMHQLVPLWTTTS